MGVRIFDLFLGSRFLQCCEDLHISPASVGSRSWRGHRRSGSGRFYSASRTLSVQSCCCFRCSSALLLVLGKLWWAQNRCEPPTWFCASNLKYHRRQKYAQSPTFYKEIFFYIDFPFFHLADVIINQRKH